MKKHIITAVYNYDDYYDETAEFAVVELSHERIKRIKELAAAVSRVKADKITEYNNDCDFKVSSEDITEDGKCILEEFDGSMDCVILNVREADFFYSGYYKHVNVSWETEIIPISAIEEPGEYDTRTAKETDL